MCCYSVAIALFLANGEEERAAEVFHFGAGDVTAALLQLLEVVNRVKNLVQALLDLFSRGRRARVRERRLIDVVACFADTSVSAVATLSAIVAASCAGSDDAGGDFNRGGVGART
ncbi:hypothetical protein CGC20_26435 [Leishmania donovani]|uniref:Uncharacterized protein n=1 Tax=Leishmania donovani TaxID=5661 RepID=A0A504XNB1_LEIDO|nr:hypothetical protein CGC20_26435 [Leishmania donovani]